MKDIYVQYDGGFYEVLLLEVLVTINAKGIKENGCTVAECNTKHYQTDEEKSKLRGMVIALNYDQQVRNTINRALKGRLKDYRLAVCSDSTIVLFYECF